MTLRTPHTTKSVLLNKQFVLGVTIDWDVDESPVIKRQVSNVKKSFTASHLSQIENVETLKKRGPHFKTRLYWCRKSAVLTLGPEEVEKEDRNERKGERKTKITSSFTF